MIINVDIYSRLFQDFFKFPDPVVVQTAQVEISPVFPEGFDMILPSERLSSAGKSEGAAKYQSLKDLFDSLALCKFAPLTPTQLCEMLNAITGWQFDPNELLAAGDRSINLKRAVSNKLGLTREQDKLPKICTAALDEGTTAGVEPDLEKMLKVSLLQKCK